MSSATPSPILSTLGTGLPISPGIPTPRRPIEQTFLQIAHRLATVALFAMLGTWALLYRGQDFRWPVLVAFGAGDVGLCAALIALVLARRDRRRGGEAMGVLVFNLVLTALSLQMLIVARLDLIRAAAEKFFSTR